MRYGHSGNAQEVLLVSSMTTSGLEAFTVDDGSNYPSTNFFVVVEKGTNNEEKVLVGSRSGNVFTPVQRGADDTTAVAHNSGSAVEHVFTATEADDANEHVMASSGVHGLGSGQVVASRGYADTAAAEAVGTHAASDGHPGIYFTEAEVTSAIVSDRPQTYADLLRPNS